MNKLFAFGETVANYEVPVLNEREVRAAAGILFFFALVSFMNSWLMGNFRLTQIFVIAFLIDFSIRVFVNPRFSPSMILGRFAVRNQTPEWAGASQKRFAWAFSFALAVAMLYLIVLNNVIGPVNLIICATCLTLLFFESAFGICLACKVYNLFHKDKAALCPGGACEVLDRHESQNIGATHITVVMLFLGIMVAVAQSFTTVAPAAAPPDTVAASDCKPPDWAVAMGHAEKWKLHHNCK